MSSLLHRFLSRVARIEPRELPAVLAAFLLFFFVLGSYFAVRPVRETVATILGRERVADLWLYTALFSMLIVPVFGWLVARVRRSVLLPGVYGAVALILAGIGSVLQADGAGVSIGVGAFFYVWISVLNLMLVSVFWSFLLEMFSSDQATRLFGVIAAGGTLGALVGPLTTRLVVNTLGNAGVLYVGTAGFLCAIGCQMALIRIWKRDREGIRAVSASASPVAASRADAALGGNPFAGIPIVLRSPYLLGIALFVMLLSAVNTFLYFEQLQIVSDTFPDTTRRTEVFATIDFVVQSLTIVSQLFLTGAIAARFGVGTLLTFVPVLMIGAFLTLAGSHVFAVIAVSLVMRRYGEYAFIRPGREMLWSTMDTETKYKAKSFIDVPVYRAADYVGAQFKTALDAVASSPSAPALVGAGIAVVWAVCGWQLGRQHDATLRGRQ